MRAHVTASPGVRARELQFRWREHDPLGHDFAGDAGGAPHDHVDERADPSGGPSSRPRAARRQDRDGRRGAAGSPGNGRAGRHDRRARLGPDDPAVHRRRHEGDRPERRARHARLHRRARALHRRRRSGAKPEAGERRRSWDDIVRMVGDAAKKARPGEWILGRGWHQEKWSRRPSPNVDGFPAARGAQPGVAEQPGLADSRQRSRRLRERDGDEDGGGARRPRPTRRAGNPARQGRQRDGPLQRARAVAHRRRARPRSRDAHARAGRSRPAPGDRTRLAGGAVERADDAFTTPARRRRRSTS